MKSLFQNEAAKIRLLEWHDSFRKKIPLPTISKTIPTIFGETHVLVGGPEEAKPLVLLHGALASSSHVLSELVPLLQNYRVYAVDIIGQSVKSKDARISVKNNDYGRWLVEVLDGLKLDKVSLVGVSWGGFVGIRTAVFAPERIRQMVLLVPAGVVNGSVLAGITKLAFPMYRYIKNPTEKRLTAFARNLLTTMNDDWLPYIGDAFLSYTMNMQVPALAKKDEFKNFTSPVFVMGADTDFSFPGKKLLDRAGELFLNLAGAEMIENSKHSPPTTDEFRSQLSDKIHAFLRDSAGVD